jgi:periplasmic divalent cation tolerance protein
MISVYITCKDKKEAKRISKHLLEKRLIACSNIFPIESMYWWNNKINEDKEIAIIAKTTKNNFDKIKKEIKNIHSYEVPCVIAWDIVEGNKDYLDWMSRITNK